MIRVPWAIKVGASKIRVPRERQKVGPGLEIMRWKKGVFLGLDLGTHDVVF